MKKLSILSTIVASLIFIGCGGSNINISDYPNRIVQPTIVPDVCKKEYKSLRTLPRVAVVKFTNNSSFGKANVHNKNSSADVELGVSENGVGAYANSNSNSVSRVVDPKLDRAIVSALEGSLVRMGGVKIYSRSDLNKVMKEQKLQQTGLLDEKTLVKVGKIAGVRYIVTGSIDSVTQEFKDYRAVGDTAANTAAHKKNKSIGTMLVGVAVKLGATVASGMEITTRATIKIIDVQTGQIVFSEPIEESKNIGIIPHPSYSQIIGAIKDDLMEGVKEAQPELSKFFAPVGYILQVRTDKDHKNFIAQINLGSKKGIKAGQTFKVYKFDEIIDPVTNKETCDKYVMNVKLKVSQNQIEPNSSWTTAEGDDAPKLRAGQIVKREALKNSLF